MTTTATKGRPRTVRASSPEVSETALQHYSRTETAKLLGVSPRYLYGLIVSGEIGYTVIAGSYKFTAEHIRAYSAANETKPGRRGTKAA